MQLTDADKALLTPDEISALTAEGADAALAAHGEPAFPEAGANASTASSGAAEEGQGAEAAAAGAEGQPPAEGTTDGAAGAPAVQPESLSEADLAAAMAELHGTQQPEAKLPTYEVPTTDFNAQRQALKTAKLQAEAKWTAGELSDTEYHAKLEEFEDQLLTLATDRARAETLRQVNEQNQRDALQRTIDAENAAMAALAAEAKKAGTIDYGTDVAAANQFDAVFSAVKADPGNASKPLAELVNKAHRAVLAMRGIDAPAASPAPAAAPASRAGAPAPAPARAVPTTLSGLPNAGQTTTQDSTWEQYSRLSGPDADDFLARLPASQVDRILRMADNYGLAH